MLNVRRWVEMSGERVEIGIKLFYVVVRCGEGDGGEE